MSPLLYRAAVYGHRAAAWVQRAARRPFTAPRARGCTCAPVTATAVTSWHRVPYEGYSIDCLAHGCFHQTHEATGIAVRSVSPDPEDPVGHYRVVLEDGEEWRVPAHEAIPPRFPCPKCGSTYVREAVTA